MAERRRYEERIRAYFREGREEGELRTDLDENVAARLFLSAANWAYTWLHPGQDTDEIADAFYALLVDGMRGYSTPAPMSATLIVNPWATRGSRRSWSPPSSASSPPPGRSRPC